MSPDVFPLTGVAFPAWTLAAFAAGVLAGVLVRRTVPAMAAAIAAWTGLAVVAARLRWHYQSAVILSNPRAGAGAPPRAWVHEYWTGPGGKMLQPSTFDAAVAQLIQKRPGPGGQLARRGYTDWVTFQPESRFWHFQLIEGGWLLALALLLGVAIVWLVRRRAT